jgi:hypothetical protein
MWTQYTYKTFVSCGALLLLGLFAAPQVRAEILIDDFTDVDAPDPWPQTIGTGMQTVVEGPGLVDVIDGWRSTTLAGTADIPGVAELRVGVFPEALEGMLDYAATAGYDGELTLLYDAGGDGLELDLTDENAVLVELIAYDAPDSTPMPITLTLTDDTGDMFSATVDATGPGTILIPFTDSPPFSTAAVTSIELFFDAPTAADFRVDSIVAVPEPAALALLAIGPFLLRRR